MATNLLFPLSFPSVTLAPAPVLDADGLTRTQRENFADFWMGLPDPQSLETVKSELVLYSEEIEARKLFLYDNLNEDYELPTSTVRDFVNTLAYSFTLDPDDDHPWQGPIITEQGYRLAHIAKDGKESTVGAHRLFRSLVLDEPLLVGQDWQLDHISHNPDKCKAKKCLHTESVNVYHLPKVLGWKNRFRSTATGAYFWEQPTECKYGHEKDFSGAKPVCVECRENRKNK